MKIKWKKGKYNFDNVNRLNALGIHLCNTLLVKYYAKQSLT